MSWAIRSTALSRMPKRSINVSNVQQIAMVAELDFKHVVRDCLWKFCGCVGEDEFSARIDKLNDQPSRTDAIYFWARARDPCFALIILYLKSRSPFRPPSR